MQPWIRRDRLFALSFVALTSASLVACGEQGVELLDPTSTAAQRVADLDPSPYGLCSHLASDAMLETFSSIGIRWYRFDCDWDMIEKQPGQYDWTDIDRTVNKVNALGGSAYCSIAYTPSWSSGSSNRAKPPRNPQDFTNFVRVFTERYSDKVACLGIWNEPNLVQFYDGSRSFFVNSMFAPGIRAIRETAPDLPICAGEVTGSKDKNLEWIGDMLAAAGNDIDIITHHQYDGDDTVSGRSSDWRKVHDYISRRGHGSKPLWMSETGWDRPRFSAQTQATNLRGMMGNMRNTSWWSKTFWYDSHGKGWGLLNGDLEANPGAPTPSFDAYREVIAGAPPSNPNPNPNPNPPPGGELTDAAIIVSHTIPAQLIAGASQSVSVTVKNTGTSTWSADTFRLGNPTNQDPFAPARVDLPSGTSVAPGGTHTFTFSMVAPTTLGARTTQWQMVHELVRWFGGNATQSINVVAPGGPDPGDGGDEPGDGGDDPGDAPPPSSGPILASGAQLALNESRLSADGRFRLILQSDGNLVLYREGGAAKWATNTAGRGGSRAVVQNDGNFVLYDGANQPLWSSATHGNSGAYVVVQNDGNLVIYSTALAPLWASNTGE